MNTELIQYVREQAAAGTSAEEIKKALLRAGWLEADVDVALKEVIGSAPASPEAAKQQDELSSYTAAKKRLHRKRLLITISIVVVVVALVAFGVYYFFLRG